MSCNWCAAVSSQGAQLTVQSQERSGKDHCGSGHLLETEGASHPPSTSFSFKCRHGGRVGRREAFTLKGFLPHLSNPADERTMGFAAPVCTWEFVCLFVCFGHETTLTLSID